MVTVQQVYDIAIHLMDEQDEGTGATTTIDTTEYKLRTISVLNSIIPGLYAYSGTYKQPFSGRGVPRQLYVDNYAEPDFEQNIPLDDVLALSVLPYYLAAQLLSSENEELAAWMKNQGREILSDVRNKVPASFEAISMPYGGF